MKRRSVLVSPFVLAAVAACSAPSDSSAPASDVDLLAKHGLTDQPVTAVVDALEADPSPRPRALRGSVKVDELTLSEGDAQLSIPLPADQFYLSIAPFSARTHDCFFHNLGTCQGELASTEVTVKITQDSGRVLVDEVTSTHTNGFVGFWLPRDVTAALTVTLADGRTGGQTISTTAEAPTCLTTVQVA